MHLLYSTLATCLWRTAALMARAANWATWRAARANLIKKHGHKLGDALWRVMVETARLNVVAYRGEGVRPANEQAGEQLTWWARGGDA